MTKSETLSGLAFFFISQSIFAGGSDRPVILSRLTTISA